MANYDVYRRLLPSEAQLVTVRRHPIFLASPLAIALAGATVAAAAAVLHESLSVRIIVWSVSALFVLSSIFRLLTWVTSRFVITSDRVLFRFGSYARDFASLSLDSVQDIQINRSLGGRIVGYGDLVLTLTGGEKQVISYLPYPEQLYLELAEAARQHANPGARRDDDADDL